MILKILSEEKKKWRCPYCKTNSKILLDFKNVPSSISKSNCNIESIVLDVNKKDAEEDIECSLKLFNINKEIIYIMNYEGLTDEKIKETIKEEKGKYNIIERKVIYIITIECNNDDCNKKFSGFEIYSEKELESLEKHHSNFDFHPIKTLEKSMNIYPELIMKDEYDKYITDDVVLKDYMEALKIKDISPNGSALLLRRFINALLIKFFNLENPDKNLCSLINYVENQENLPQEVKNTLTQIRLKGNMAAHPDQYDGNVITLEIINKLFMLSNLLIEDTYKKRYQKNEREKERQEALSGLNQE